MTQLSFFAILPFVLPALGANLRGRNNWGTTTAAISSVAGSPALPSIGFPPVVSSFAASPVFPSVDIPISTVVASPVPTSYFNCGGSNFTLTGSSYAGQPTGVTTVTYNLPSGIASASFTSDIAYPSSSIASGPVTVTYSGLAARNNWGTAVSSTVVGTPSSFIAPIGMASTGVAPLPIGTASSSAASYPDGTAIGECPYPTTTVYVSGSSGVVSATPSGSTNAVPQLGQQGGTDTGAAVGVAVSAGSVVMAAIAVVAHLL